LIEADLRGVYSHGVIRAAEYSKRLKNGLMNPRPNICVLRETAATALMDGDNGSGQVVGVRAMEVAIHKAKQAGVGYVVVRSSNHFGTCAYYAQMAVSHDMIGVVTNAGGRKIMAPWGGVTPLLSNNPFAAALPTDKEFPVVLDMACSVVARGKINHAAKVGLPIPSGWALNRRGEPTTDPREAFEGLIQPVGGYKGYGLAFTIAALAELGAQLSAGESTTSASGSPLPTDSAKHCFQAIDVAAFMDPVEFKARMDSHVERMHASQLARGTERIYVPGEIEWLNRKEKLESGIPVATAVWKELLACSEEVGVEPPLTI